MLTKTKQLSTYLRLRFSCLSHELRQLTEQVKNLLLWVAVFLGPAILALVFGILLAIGQLYNTEQTARQMLMLCWSLMALQNLLVWLCRHAILTTRYRLYLQTLPCSERHRRLADLLLLCCCLPVFWLHTLVVANANLSQWQSVLPQLSFLLLQLASAYLVLYRPKRSIFALLLAIPIISQMPDIVSGLFTLGALGLLLPLLPAMSWRLSYATTSNFRLWLKLWSHEPEQWLSRLLLIALITMICHITLNQRPDLTTTVLYFCSALLILVCCTMQLSNNRLLLRYPLFFRQFSTTTVYWQYLAPAMLAILSLSALWMLGAGAYLLLFSIVLCCVGLVLAKIRPHQLVAAWFILVILISFLLLV